MTEYQPEGIISSSNAKALHDYLATIVKGKIIRGLDLEKSNDPNLTDKFLVYLSEENYRFTDNTLLIWKIYGFRDIPGGKNSLCSSLHFCFGEIFENSKLPDKSNFDRKDSGISGLSESEVKKLEALIEHPNWGFKNAIGQRVVDFELNLLQKEIKMVIDVELHESLRFINIILRQEMDEDFELYIYYD